MKHLTSAAARAALCAMADQKQGARTQHLRRDSAGPPIGTARSQQLVGGVVHKAKGGGHHRQRVVALN